jgi:glycogen phosphorylase
MAPRTFFFAGRAAPAYRFTKLIIKFANNLAGTIDGAPVTRGRLKVVFLPNYNAIGSGLRAVGSLVC